MWFFCFIYQGIRHQSQSYHVWYYNYWCHLNWTPLRQHRTMHDIKRLIYHYITLRTCSHRIKHTAFWQIQPKAASKILVIRQYDCTLFPCSLLNYAQKSAHSTYENKFSIFLLYASMLSKILCNLTKIYLRFCRTTFVQCCLNKMYMLDCYKTCLFLDKQYLLC